MSCLVYIDGLLEPVEVDEPFQATFQSVGGALRNGISFFQSKNMAGELVSVSIPRILYVREISD